MTYQKSVFVSCLCLLVMIGCATTKETIQAPDLCEKAVKHLTAIMEKPLAGSLEAGPKAIMNLAESVSIRSCRVEGLSQEQADCIFGAKDREGMMKLGSCPAIEKKQPVWLRLPPSQAQLEEIKKKQTPPDGPHTTKLSYKQLVGSGGSTCGLTEDNALQCWGSRERVPEGSFIRLEWQWHLCGLDASGLLSCEPNHTKDTLAYLPKEPLLDFEEGSFHGCGILRQDKTIVCWSEDPAQAIAPPKGSFEQVVSGLEFSCAIRADGSVLCFGPKAPTIAPEKRFVTLSAGLFGVCGIEGDQALSCFGDFDGEKLPEGRFAELSCGNAHCCAIREDQTLSCWGSDNNGRALAPEGKFSVVRASVEHSCAVKVEGGTVCWGKNHFGQTNPPQEKGSHHWFP